MLYALDEINASPNLLPNIRYILFTLTQLQESYRLIDEVRKGTQKQGCFWPFDLSLNDCTSAADAHPKVISNIVRNSP